MAMKPSPDSAAICARLNSGSQLSADHILEGITAASPARWFARRAGLKGLSSAHGIMRALNRHVERVFSPTTKTRIGDAGRWHGIDDPRIKR